MLAYCFHIGISISKTNKASVFFDLTNYSPLWQFSPSQTQTLAQIAGDQFVELLGKAIM